MEPPIQPAAPEKASRTSSEAEPTTADVVSEMFERYATEVYRFAYRRLGNREDAQDVTAQVFLKATRSLDPTFSEEARRAWLFRAARSAVVDVWRSYGDCPVVPLDWYVEEPSPPVRENPGAAPRLEQILARLEPRQRRILELRFLRGSTLAETAAELGITEGHAKVLQHRALRRAAELDREGKDVRLA